MKTLLMEFYSNNEVGNLKLEELEVDVDYGKEKGYMAKRNLKLLQDYANNLLELLESGEELPEWVESEIAKASDTIHDCYHYLEYR